MAKTSTKKPSTVARVKPKKAPAKSAPSARPKATHRAKMPPASSAKAARPAKVASAKQPVKQPAPEYVAPAPPTPVPTDGKPRKNQAGISPKDLEHYRELLLDKRRELVGDMSSMEREALRSGSGTNLSNLPIHMADMGTDNYEQEFTLGLMEKDRNLLREINQALAKIQDGTYGICEGTGKPIGRPRLEAQPWARFSIEHARKLEKGILR